MHQKCTVKSDTKQSIVGSFWSEFCSELMGGWGWGSVLRESCSPQYNRKKWRRKSGLATAVQQSFFEKWRKTAKIPVLGKPTHMSLPKSIWVHCQWVHIIYFNFVSLSFLLHPAPWDPPGLTQGQSMGKRDNLKKITLAQRVSYLNKAYYLCTVLHIEELLEISIFPLIYYNIGIKRYNI